MKGFSGSATGTGRLAALAAAALLLVSCTPGELQFGSRTLSLPFGGSGASTAVNNTPSVPAERFGRGPVTVALLLPLSGEPTLSAAGRVLANASRLAIDFINTNPNIGENITIALRDTGDTAAGASRAATAAISDGARLILGPLTSEQLGAAGAVARAAGVPLIGFSNNATHAGNGVYVLALLPEQQMQRALRYLMAQGRRGPAGVFPATPYGEAMATAFRQQAIATGFNPQAVYTFSSPSEAASIVAQAKPLIERGLVDALFLPDPASAPAFGAALAAAGVDGAAVQLVGSADWAEHGTLFTQPALQGAIFPAVDESGLNAIAPAYQARFGARPPQMATIAYTATILANVNTLSLASPPYNPATLTNPAGFNGRDGLFRFRADGRSDYALAIRRISGNSAATLEGPRL